VVTTANLQLTPAALSQVRKHAIHGDIQRAGAICATRARSRAGVWLALRLCLLLKQHLTELFSGLTHAIGTDVDQGQAFEDLGGLHKRILGGAQQGQQFIKRLRAAAGTDLKHIIERMLAHSTLSAQVVGTPNRNRTKQGGNLGLALTLIGCQVATSTADGGTWLLWPG
jgi:hypothetical protein